MASATPTTWKSLPGPGRKSEHNPPTSRKAVKKILICILTAFIALSASAQVAKTDAERRDLTFQKLDHDYEGAVIVFLADVRIEGRNLLITPTEQFKGSGLVLGRDIRLQYFKEKKEDEIMEQRIFYFPFHPNANTWKSTVIKDGRVRLVPEVSLEEIREYFSKKNYSNHSVVTTPEAPPPSS